MVKEVKTREPSGYLRRRRIETNSHIEGRPSLYTDDIYHTINNIHIEDLLPYTKQARANFNEDKINELAETIRIHGVRQPLTVLPSEQQQGKYEVVSGERRLRAAKLAGLSRVPCIIIHNHKDAREIALIENLQREDLTPIEEAMAYKGLIEEGICSTQSEVARKLCISEGHVSEMIKLTSLPKEILERITANHIKKRADLRKIMKAESLDEMRSIIQDTSNPSENIQSRTIRTNQQKILDVLLIGEKIKIKRGNTKHLSRSILEMLHSTLLSLAKEIKPD